MKHKALLFALLLLDGALLFYEASTLSISYDEARLLYESKSLVALLSNLSISLFGSSDIALRAPMILLHLASCLLLYHISALYLKREQDRLYLVAVYMMLPGIVSAALVVHISGVVLFGLFLFVLLYLRGYRYQALVLLLLYAIVHQGFFYLFFSLLLYALYTKERPLALVALGSMALSYYLFGSDIGGYPSGHFLDALGIYAAIFSPIPFIYIIYVLYRRFLMRQMDLLWFIATTVLLLSLLLSLRQRLHLEIYAPYLMLALPLAAQSFAFAYRVRLRPFRKRYKLLFSLSLLFLALHYLLLLNNKYLYLFLDNPKRHFAYEHAIAKELAKSLRARGINCLQSDAKMQLRLRFYAIEHCSNYRLTQAAIAPNSKSVTVSYYSKPIFSAYVTNLNRDTADFDKPIE